MKNKFLKYLDLKNTPPSLNSLKEIKRFYAQIRDGKKDLSGKIDPEIIQFLDRINKYPFIATVFSCWGHPSKKNGYLYCNTTLNKIEFYNLIWHPFRNKCIKLDYQPYTLSTDIKPNKFTFRFNGSDVYKTEMFNLFIEVLDNITSDKFSKDSSTYDN